MKKTKRELWRIDPAKMPVRSRGMGVFARFMSNRLAVIALIYIILISTVSIFAPLFSTYERDGIDLQNIMASPSSAHFLGTDLLGRDTFTRLMYGARFSLFVALGSISIATMIGVFLGSLAGFFGGLIDYVVTAIVDIFLSIPIFLVLLIAASVFGGTLLVIPLVIGSVSWMETARIVRAKIQSMRKSGFVEASFTIGERSWLIVLKHVLPHVASSIAVSATIGFANVMLIESALSFLGYGIQPPVPTWGNMLNSALTILRTAPMAAFAPGLLIFITCLCFNLLGKGLKSSLAYSENLL
ncbi:ABC transporter permease [bacterium]|nr:ABC transporter permease [bacterium]